MVIGGSTTSLLSILDNIDYEKYEVDLLLLDEKGELHKNIHQMVNVIKSDTIVKEKTKHEKLMSVPFIHNYLWSIILSKKYSNPLVMHQVRSKHLARYSGKINTQYDVAISFLEFWPTNYVAYKVEADKKIAWLHVDYLGAGLASSIDAKTYKMFDKIVTVSEQCETNLRNVFPHLKDNIICINNILSQNTIRSLSNQEKINISDDKELKIVSVCRISFDHKGLDRGVEALARLKDENMISNNYTWYIIGDGPDKEKLQRLITINNLNDNIKLLGSKQNPHVYVKQMDVFFLPSRYEGMPMAVTEAQMLGVVPCVTNYASAKNQITNGISGIIMENSNEDIYYYLKNIINKTVDIEKMKKNLIENDYSNQNEMYKIYEIL